MNAPDRTLADLVARVGAAWQAAWPPTGAPELAAPSLPGAAAALSALALARLHPDACVLAVVAGPRELDALQTDLEAFAAAAGLDALCLPALDAGDAAADDPELAGARLAALQGLGAASPAADALPAPRRLLLATTVAALRQRVPDPQAVRAAARTLRRGDTLPFAPLVADLSAAGYARAAEVTAKGELAVRGGLLDLWPPTEPLPVRLEFFGDTLESLRRFDPATQRSLDRLDTLWAPPCAAAPLPDVPLPELLPPGAVVLWLEHDALAAAALADAADAAPAPADAWLELRQALAARRPRRQVFCGDPPPAGVPSLPLSVCAVPGLADLGDDPTQPDLLAAARRRLLDGLEARARGGDTVLVCLDTAGSCEWLARELPADSGVRLRQAALSGGCAWPGQRLLLFAQPDLYAVRKLSGRRALPSATASRGGRVERGGDLHPGDLVVHLDHGIGRYVGTTEMALEERRVEVLTIEYAEGARLHVPVAHAHLLSRYIGVAGHAVRLHRLGGRRWTREKVEAERAIADLAAELLDVQARRSLRPGTAFDVDPPWLHAFEAAFPFRETPDQARCIAEVKADMAAPRPMDRLICGDAGYGKTEVALRAAFIAVTNARQVAVLVPTTVLAEQHYETFRERLAAFPVRVEVLSRFRTRGRRAAVLRDLAAGAVDIVIGTHALIQPHVAFKNLGLVVIDEEQRFGVVHKERLKQVRALVDVLTLTATPIPRTLHLSMTGARDMSLLQTPPQERVAIETRVERDSDAVIRAAILHELAREGQVYFLHNRVLTIDLMLQRLRRIVPEARLDVGHGQMPAAQLAAVMRRFERGACNVLLCTTIVESGLDIPRANTIIVHRADRFGLAELYQLRGRVGRASQRAFAYLLLPPHGHLDEEARQRIAALRRHGGLGDGFNLALRDLEIRGAGNLLGAAQSGHIAAIGFGLYCQLLRRTVARLKGEQPPPLIDVDLQLDFLALSPGAPDEAASACLPYAYVDDEPNRLQAHRRLAEAATVAEVRALREELADRYGPPPPPAVRLLRLAELRLAAAARDLARLEVREDVVRLIRRRDQQPLTLPDGRLPRLRPGTPDQRLTALFRLLAAPLQ